MIVQINGMPLTIPIFRNRENGDGGDSPNISEEEGGTPLTPPSFSATTNLELDTKNSVPLHNPVFENSRPITPLPLEQEPLTFPLFSLNSGVKEIVGSPQTRLDRIFFQIFETPTLPIEEQSLLEPPVFTASKTPREIPLEIQGLISTLSLKVFERPQQIPLAPPGSISTPLFIDFEIPDAMVSLAESPLERPFFRNFALVTPELTGEASLVTPLFFTNPPLESVTQMGPLLDPLFLEPFKGIEAIPTEPPIPLLTPSFANFSIPQSTPKESNPQLDIPIFACFKAAEAILAEPPTSLFTPSFAGFTIPQSMPTANDPQLDVPIFTRIEATKPIPKETVAAPDSPTFQRFVKPDTTPQEVLAAPSSPQLQHFETPEPAPKEVQQSPAIPIFKRTEDPVSFPKSTSRAPDSISFKKYALPQKVAQEAVEPPKKPLFKQFRLPHPRLQKELTFPSPFKSDSAKNLGSSSKIYSYEELFQEARRVGSVSDIRKLLRHSLLKPQYIHDIFRHLIRDFRNILPKSSQFHLMDVLDTEQLQMFLECCDKLKNIYEIVQLETLNLLPNPYVDHLKSAYRRKIELHPRRKLRKKEVNEAAKEELLMQQAREKMMINIKNFFYCFISAYCFQQEKLAKKNAPPIEHENALTALKNSLQGLGKQIKRDIDAIELRTIFEAKKLKMLQYEDRKPIAPGTVAKLIKGFDQSELDRVDMQLNDPNLTAPNLEVFINQVLAHPEGDATQRHKKAEYLVKLTRRYGGIGDKIANSPPPNNDVRQSPGSAWEDALKWNNYALETLSPEDNSIPRSDPQYLACLHLRATIELKVAKYLYNEDLSNRSVVSTSSTSDSLIPKHFPGIPSSRVVVIRPRIDSAYRDFMAASAATDYSTIGPERENHVRAIEQAKGKQDPEEQLPSLKKGVEIDNDYAEAYYREFLAYYEKVKLHEKQSLHEDFSDLRQTSNNGAFALFCRKLLSSFLFNSLVRVQCDGESIYMKIEENRILMDRSSTHYIDKMLSLGISHVKQIHHLPPRTYLAEVITREQFGQRLDRLKNDLARLKEIEQALQLYHVYEISAIYKSTMIPGDNTPLTYQSIRQRQSNEFRLRLVDLHLMAMRGHQRLHALPTALLHLSHAIDELTKMISEKKDPVLEKEKLTLLIKRAMLYKEMDLDVCHLDALGEAVSFGKKCISKFYDFSLAYALANAYLSHKRFSDAQQQLNLLLSHTAPGQANKLKDLERRVVVEKPVVATSLDKKQQEVVDDLLFLLRQRFDPKLPLSLFQNDNEWQQFKANHEEAANFKTLIKILFQPVILQLSFKERAKVKNLSSHQDTAPFLERMKQETMKLLAGYRGSAIFSDFQDKNIEDECFQLLHEHYRCNAHPGTASRAPIWDSFINELNKVTKLRHFCELILAKILPSNKVSEATLKRIVRLANLELSDLRSLDEIKSYTLDALAKYTELDAQMEDALAKKAAEARKAVEEIKTFNEFKRELRSTLREGTLIRPGSTDRNLVANFKSCLSGANVTASEIIGKLQEICNNDPHKEDPSKLGLTEQVKNAIKDNTNDLKGELLEIVNAALDLKVDPAPKEEENGEVLTYAGYNVFVSEIINNITSRGQSATVRDIHIIGINVYVDTDITLSGKNVAIGGQYIQFMTKTDGAKINIDLSGTPGTRGAEVASPNPARAGTGPSEAGAWGENGHDGTAGYPGGDLLIKSEVAINSLNNGNVNQINISGGVGGEGTNGQAGGKGADGVAGQSFDKEGHGGWHHGYIYHEHGGKGVRAGDGGKGGDLGLGGKGGKTGILDINPKPQGISIIENDGADAANGLAGEGGKAGTPQPDGVGYVIGKPGCFGGNWHDRFIAPKCHGDEFQKNGWHDETTIQASLDRNSANNHRNGLSAEEQKRANASITKQRVKSTVFATNLQKHLQTQSAGSKALAFDAVTNRSAALHFAEKILNQELSQQQAKRKDLENLFRTTKQLLQQSQQETTMQTERVASAAPIRSQEIDRENLVRSYIRPSERDFLNLLPFQKYSPVLRDPETLLTDFTIEKIELAIDGVNRTEGRDGTALVHLIRTLSQEGEIRRSQKKQLDGLTLHKQLQLQLRIRANKAVKKLHKVLPQLVERLPLKEQLRFSGKIKTAAAHLPKKADLDLVLKQMDEKARPIRREITKEMRLVQTIYQNKRRHFQIKKAIVQFFRRDRLSFAYACKPGDNEQQKKWLRWIEQRLVILLENHRCKPEEYPSYIKFAMEVLTDLQKKKLNERPMQELCKVINERNEDNLLPQPKTEKENDQDIKELTTNYKNILKKRHNKISNQLSKLNSHEKWMVDHLPDLLLIGSSPSKVLETKQNLIDLYNTCVAKWQAMDSLPCLKREPYSSPALKQVEDPYREWMTLFKQKDNDEKKLLQVEGYIRELERSIPQNRLPLRIEILLENYPERPEFNGILAVIVALSRTIAKDAETEEALEKLKTNDPDQLFKLRKKYLSQLDGNDVAKDQANLLIVQYIMRRSWRLRYDECLRIVQENPATQRAATELSKTIAPLLLRAMRLHEADLFLDRDVDFMKAVQEVFQENTEEILRKLQANTQTPPPEGAPPPYDPFDEVVRKVTRIQHASNDQLAELVRVLEQMVTSRAPEEYLHEQIYPRLFVLANRHLPYEINMRIVGLLSQKSVRTFVNNNPILQRALSFFQQQVQALQQDFEAKWQRIIKHGQELDQIRFQLDPSDEPGIEELLHQIEAEAALCSPQEKIGIINQMMQSMSSTTACYTILRKLRKLQSSLIHKRVTKEVLQHPTQNKTSDYLKAVKVAFEDQKRRTDITVQEYLARQEAGTTPEQAEDDVSLEKHEANALQRKKELNAPFIEMIKAAFDPQMILHCLYALHHYTLDHDQMIYLYQTLTKLDPDKLNAQQKQVWKKCLKIIPQKLMSIVTNSVSAEFTKRKDVNNTVQKQIFAIVEDVKDALKSTQVLFPERHAAKMLLRMQLIHTYYETQRTDADGTIRKKQFKDAFDEFSKGLSGDVEKSLEKFHAEQRDKANQLIQPGCQIIVDTVRTHLANLVKDPSHDDRKNAETFFNTFYLRDIISYADPDDSKDTILKAMPTLKEEQEKFIKRKFDDIMIIEDATQVAQELQKQTSDNETRLKKWIDELEKWIEASDGPLKNFTEVFPNKTALDTLFKTFQVTSVPAPATRVIPPDGGPNTMSEIMLQLHEVQDKPHFPVLFEENRSLVESYFELLEKTLKDLPPYRDTSWDMAVVKTLKEAISYLPSASAPNSQSLQGRVNAFEEKLYARAMRQPEERTKKINILVDVVKATYEYTEENDRQLSELEHKKLKEEFARLDSSIQAASAILAERGFFQLLEYLQDYSAQHPKSLSLPMLQNLFWVVPRLDRPEEFLQVANKHKPERWAVILLEQHVMTTYLRAAQRKIKEIPPINVQGPSEGKKEKKIEEGIKEVRKKLGESLQEFQKGITRLSTTPKMPFHNKERILRLLAERLELLNQGKLSFSLDEFAQVLKQSLEDDKTIEHLSAVLPNPLSPITRALYQPSFETLKYGLTLVWIVSTLGLDVDNRDHRILVDSLFTIATARKDEGMRQVVKSLQGTENARPLITASVIEAVSHFANKSWDIDSTVLDLLKNRSATNNWFVKMENHVKSLRGEELTLYRLVKIMTDEKDGINKSIAHLLDKDMKLQKDIEDIHEKYKEVKDYDADKIKDWVKKHRRVGFGETPDELKEGIAVVSRGCELINKFPLRDTQLIALWIKLRPENSSKGRISQMATGEGKSFVIASLAILTALTTSPVDMITTSFVLAARDAKDNQDLFKLFGMICTNNCDKEAEASEEKRKERYYNSAENRHVDIVYGDVGSFERDILLTLFHDKNVILPARLNRSGTVIVDEVDGLFLDNASMVLYLSHNVDTLRFLQSVFETVWTVANLPQFEQAHPSDDNSVAGVTMGVRQRLSPEAINLPQYKISEATFMEMQPIIDRKMTIWVRSALHAKKLTPNDEYIIIDQLQGDVKRKSVIVMDKGTGLEQFSLKWNNGLHQFLQLKHGLELSSESLKAVFLSNYFFFKRYGTNLYGLSGTLGSDSEQKYLDQLYNVDLCKIPRFKGERIIYENPIVVGDQTEWINTIYERAKTVVNEKQRAVLIICNTIQDVLDVEKKLKPDYPNLLVYTSSLQTDDIDFFAKEDARKVAPGDVIIATNLAGRGTDFKTNPVLEAHYGLHVMMTYLPDNIRIQEQGFGRTGRSGNEGSAEFIIKDDARRDITQLFRIRDQAEKHRLEMVASKEVEKIKLEHELLSGLHYNGERIEGFQSLLKEVREDLEGKEEFYREAQLSSLKNRWAFWLDHMEEKIGLVHIIGKDGVIQALKAFQKGIYKDFYNPDDSFFRLVKEPMELIKLGGHYRRKEQWSNAMKCYSKAAEDKHYRYVAYYQAACDFIQEPTSSVDAKKRFKAQAKVATKAIKPEITQMQNAVQNITPLVDQLRLRTGAADYGNPYKAREEDKIQIWSIFLSAIDGAIGTSCSADSFKGSQYGQNPENILRLAGVQEHYKKPRISKRLVYDGTSKKLYLRDKSNKSLGEPLPLPQMFAPVFAQLHREGADYQESEKRMIDKKALETMCAVSGVITQESVKSILEDKGIPCTKNTLRIGKLSPSFENWPAGTSDQAKGLMSLVLEQVSLATYENDAAVVDALKKQTDRYPAFEKFKFAEFVQSLKNSKTITNNPIIQLGVKFQRCKQIFNTPDEAMAAFEADFFSLTPDIKRALAKATFGGEKSSETSDKLVWKFQEEASLNDLPFPTSEKAAAETLWTLLEEYEAIKPPKFKAWEENFSEQKKKIEEALTKYFEGPPFNKSGEALKDAAKDILSIIESSMGMIHGLEGKKTTAKFAEIKQKYFLDQGKHFPPGIAFFIELGLEVVASLVEKKDPPAWYEVAAVIVMGVVQMVAGAIIKAYLPFAGELIGNALLSTGMDDIMFAINSAISGEFSWDDYAAHKVESLKRSIISSAIGCGLSFGASSINNGLDKAWQAQQLSTAAATHGAFNLTSHIVTEVGRNFIATGVSQVVSRGLGGMTELIASSYKGDIEKEIAKAIQNHWSKVEEESQALFKKIGKSATTKTKIEGCIRSTIKKISESSFFDGAIRASRQAVGSASSLIALKGWSDYLAYAPDIANLGVSIPKMVNMVEDSVNQLARQIRETHERETEVTENAEDKIDDTAFTKFLGEQRAQFSIDVAASFNQVLNGTVYTPLISTATREMQKAAMKALMPESLQEQFRHSVPHVLKLQEYRLDPNQSFGDDRAFREWAGADAEVAFDDLREDLKDKAPANDTQSLRELKNQYGDRVHIFADGQGHVFVQRPGIPAYTEGTRHGEAAAAPEVLSLASGLHHNIAFRHPDGSYKTYTTEGRIVDKLEGEDPIILDVKKDSDLPGVGHVSLGGDKAGQDKPTTNPKDCLYAAVGGVVDRDIASLRNLAADGLTNNPDLQKSYHDWSNKHDPKEFFGHNLSDCKEYGSELLTAAGQYLRHGTLSGMITDIATSSRENPLQWYETLKAANQHHPACANLLGGTIKAIGEYTGSTAIGGLGGGFFTGASYAGYAHAGAGLATTWKEFSSGQELNPPLVALGDSMGLPHGFSTKTDDALSLGFTFGADAYHLGHAFFTRGVPYIMGRAGLAADNAAFREARYVEAEVQGVLPKSPQVRLEDLRAGQHPKIELNTADQKQMIPENFEEIFPELPRKIRENGSTTIIQTSDRTRIRIEEAHPPKPDKKTDLFEKRMYNPREHERHLHFEWLTPEASGWNNPKFIRKLYPPGVQKGEPTGFHPGDEFPW